jgi:hypothetical protein
MGDADDHAFDAGSKITADRETSPHGVPPPVTSTRSSSNRTAAGPRATASGSGRVSDQVPVVTS